ncbi:MAG: SulP family inorganic anion transporter, partial [Proteobacteria bacterium]|nr:SulP family inorganic anion transporter [Pseudomonadota bacterium]
ETLKIITPYALILAAIGLIESLLTLTLIDDITNTKENKNSRECFFQGVANFVTGFFGGMGGCAMIGQSMINIKSGGRGRLSGFSAAMFLILFILFFSKLIELIPVATLVGIMFVVVIATFEWSSLKIINKIPRADLLVIVAVTLITVFTDLAIAVVCGVIISSLVFSWKSAQNVHARTMVAGDNLEDDLTYIIYGQLFFASVENFKAIFPATERHKSIVIDFANTRIWDHSALEAVENVAQKYLAAGKKLKLIHLSENCRGLLDKAENCIVSSPEDPNYRMAVLERDGIL